MKKKSRQTEATDEQMASIKSVIGYEPLSSTEIATLSGIDISIVRLALPELIDKGSHVKTGTRRWTRYARKGHGSATIETEKFSSQKDDFSIVKNALSDKPVKISRIVKNTGLEKVFVKSSLKTLMASGYAERSGEKGKYLYCGINKPVKINPTSDKAVRKLPPPLISQRAPAAASKRVKPRTPREAVDEWLKSVSASSWDEPRGIAKGISADSGINRADIQEVLRDYIKEGKILREWHKGPEGQYRLIKKA